MLPAETDNVVHVDALDVLNAVAEVGPNYTLLKPTETKKHNDASASASRPPLRRRRLSPMMTSMRRRPRMSSKAQRMSRRAQ